MSPFLWCARGSLTVEMARIIGGRQYEIAAGLPLGEQASTWTQEASASGPSGQWGAFVVHDTVPARAVCCHSNVPQAVSPVTLLASDTETYRSRCCSHVRTRPASVSFTGTGSVAVSAT